MENYIDLLRVLVPVFTSLFTLLGLWLKISVDNKKQIKREEVNQNIIIQKVEKINKVQTENITSLQVGFKKMQKKLDWLTDIHKYKDDQTKIFLKLEEIIEDHTAEKNKEVGRILFNALEKITPLFETFFSTDFKDIQKDKVYKAIKRKASSIRPNINANNLQLNVPQGKKLGEVRFIFLEKLKNAIKPDIKNFCRELEEIAEEKTNGARVDAFTTIAKTLINKISEKTVKIHADFIGKK